VVLLYALAENIREKPDGIAISALLTVRIVTYTGAGATSTRLVAVSVPRAVPR
jgi:hypothetical protein